MTDNDIDKMIDQNVTLIGTAKNAKAGAILITTENSAIYIKGLDYWAPELLNQQLTVSGVLKREKFIPDPVIDKSGGISTGAYGIQLILDNAEYSIVE